MIKAILFLFFVFYTGSIQSEEILSEWQRSFEHLNSAEKQYLESFFRTMLTQSEGGFVLGGSKPACMEGILSPEKLNIRHIGTKVHERSVVLCEGYRIWKKYFEDIPSSKLIICCKDHPDQIYSAWIHLMWINPQKLVEVVQENLVLFQYVLGPQLTPTSFLKFLTDPAEDIPHDYALTGIFLGFGSQNALYYRRLELIQKQSFSRETPPFKPKNEQVDTFNRAYLGFDRTKSFETEPSFSFSTLREEYQALNELGSSSLGASASYCKIPLFSVYKKDRETLDILSRYEKDQELIENLLLKTDFLKQILRYIFI